MSQQSGKAAVLSKTVQFLTAGGLTLAIAVVQEVLESDRDWTMVAGLVIGIGGGAYGCIVAQEPLTSVLPK